MKGRELTGSPGLRGSVPADSGVSGTLQRRVLLLVLFPFAVVLTGGCVSKAKARADARAAFVAGERQAMQNMQEFRNRGPTVSVLGEVRNTLIPWTEELTLGKALLQAEYTGGSDPAEILIVRDGQATRYDPKKLLGGEDVPLKPRDTVFIKH